MPQRSKHQNGGQWIRPDLRLSIYLRDGFTCAWCNEDLRDQPGQLTLDHYRSRAAGGGNRSNNLVTSCRSCNSDRRDRSAREFLVERYSAAVFMVPQRTMAIYRQRRRSIKRYRKVAREILSQLGLPDGKRDLTEAVRQANAHRGEGGPSPEPPPWQMEMPRV